MAEGGERSDIKKAKGLLVRVKNSLEFSDEDSLGAGKMRVQPLYHLDQEILKHKDAIKKTISDASQNNDDVPEKLLAKVDHVIQIGEGKTTLFKASELLEVTSKPFDYARQAARNNLALSNRSDGALDQFDHSFKEMMAARVDVNTDKAQKCEEDCLRHLDMAVRASKEDYLSWRRMADEEERRLEEVGDLEEVGEAIEESVQVEIEDIKTIKEQCTTDMEGIDSKMKSFEQEMKKALQEYQDHKKIQENKLEENRREQEGLRQRLAQLEGEERGLVSELQEGEAQDSKAEAVKKGVAKDIEEWRGNIAELKDQASTSLQVMTEMSDVTKLILNDAKSKQSSTELKLSEMEEASLLMKHDALGAQGVMYKMITSDSQENMRAIDAELVRLQVDKKSAAKTNLRIKVQEIKSSMENYNAEKLNYAEKYDESKAKYEEVVRELEEVDASLKKLSPHLKLETLEAKYSERKRNMDKAFDEETVEGINFSSRGH